MTKYGQPVVGGAGVERLRDVGVVHHGERLPLALEAGEHLAGVHPAADHLEGDRAAERLELLGLVDRAHPALAEDADDAVGADAGGWAVRSGRWRRQGAPPETTVGSSGDMGVNLQVPA